MKRVLLIGFMLAALLGGWRLTTARLERERAAGRRADVVRAEQIELLRAEINRLETARRTTADQNTIAPAPNPAPGPALSPRTAQQQAPSQLAGLIARKLVQLNQDLSAEDVLTPNASGAFPEPFAKLFDLDEAGATKLREGMIGIKQRVEALIVAHTVFSRNSSGTVVMAFDPLPEGEALRTELRDLMIGALGQERFNAFLALRSAKLEPHPGGDHLFSPVRYERLAGADLDGIDDFYYAFGADGVITTVTQGGRRYLLQRVKPGTQPPPPFPATPTNIPNRAELLRLLGPQAALLPADF